MARGGHPPRLAAGWAALAALLPGVPVHRRPKLGYTVVVASSRHLACLFPPLGLGPKHHRTIVLAGWQRDIALERNPGRFLRGLLHSDGCRTSNEVTRQLVSGPRSYRYPRYFFSNRSADI